MMRLIDSVIDSVTMYRLTLYVLLGYIAIGAIQAYEGFVAFSPIDLLASTAFLVVMCWAANTILARIFNVPTNVESATLTALILALILDPATLSGGLALLGWAAILAMSSKYILALYNKHIFNPAAISVVLTALVLNQSASWWMATASMFPWVVIGGLLIVRKVRQEALVVSFLTTAIVAECVVSVFYGLPVPTELRRLVIESPLIFLASVMLTEPLTMPPTKGLKMVYGMITGVLFIPQIHLGSLYSTPELALVVGNVFAYLVSPKKKLVLTLRRRTKLSHDTFEFLFSPPQPLAYAPGQYMEWTLGHPHADSRGNRRYFTLASSPTERGLNLGVKFSERGSSFKRSMLGLNKRSTIIAGQIAGDFTLPADPQQKLVFIAGGIGITPFRSMLKYLVDIGQPRDIIVIYANRTADDIVYNDMLDEAYQKLRIPTVYTLTDTSAIPRNWSGGVGRIDAEMIADVVPDFRERTFYLSGPPQMVRAAEQALKTLRVSGSRIKKDFFPGLV